MISRAVTLMSKGIIADNVVSKVTSGVITLIKIDEIEVPEVVHIDRGNQHVYPPTIRRKKLVRVLFEYDNESFTHVQYVDEYIRVSQIDVDIEVVDKKPIVKLIFNHE